MKPDTPAPAYLDDLAVGDQFRSGEHAMDEDQIKAFAAQFDPQPFHLDDAAARATLFGGLAASGWHTAAVTMRLQVTSGLPIAGGIIGAGGELSWPRPTRATDCPARGERGGADPALALQARPGHGHRAQRDPQPARRRAAGIHRAHRGAASAARLAQALAGFLVGALYQFDLVADVYVCCHF